MFSLLIIQKEEVCLHNTDAQLYGFKYNHKNNSAPLYYLFSAVFNGNVKSRTAFPKYVRFTSFPFNASFRLFC